MEVTCRLKYSGAAEAFLGLAAVGTLAIVVLVPFPAEARLALFAWVVGAATCARAKLRRIRGLRLGSDGTVEVQVADRLLLGRLAPRSFVAPWLTVLNWRPEGARVTRTIVLLPGMVGDDALRIIRVILRWA